MILRNPVASPIAGVQIEITQPASESRGRFAIPGNLLTITALLSVALLSAATLVSTPAMAQQVATSGRNLSAELEEMIVTGDQSMTTTLPLELARYGADLEIVTAEQIRNHGFVDVSQALEMLVPGVHLTTQAGAFSYVNLQMQGSRGSDVLWTVDGVRINNRLYNSTSPADTLPSNMIERTEVLKGGHSLMYGTQAIAGVVNVVTRSFSETPTGGVSLGTGSHGMRKLSAYGSNTFGDHKLVAWASLDQSNGYEIYDNYQPNAVNRKRGYDVQSVGLKYGYDFNADWSLTLTGIRTSAELDYPNVSNVSINDRMESIISARLDYAPESGPQYFLKAYYHDWDTDYYTPPNPSAYWGYDDMGLSAGTLIPAHRNFNLHLGYDHQSYKGQDDVLLISGERERVHAFYGQIRSTDELSEQLRFATGLRYDSTGGNESTVWNFSTVYDINDYLYVQGIVGTSFMLPSAENLYRIHCPSGAGCTHGNPNLAPEESFAVNLSVGGRLDIGERPISWQLTGWNRRVDNLITRQPIPLNHPNPPGPEFTQTYINIPDEVKQSGAEILFRGPITQSLSFDLSYTHSREIQRGTDHQLRDRPRTNYKVALSYQSQSLPFGMNIAIKYIGDKTSDVTGFGVQSYGNVHVVDLGAHYYPAGRDGNHRVGMRVENALNKEYATSVNSAVLDGSDPAERFMWRRLAPPRTLHVTYSYQF